MAVRTAVALPREIQVEVTGACNLQCKMCLVRYRPRIGRKTGALPLATFHRLLDELPELERVTLQGLGEPLLAPGLLEMVEACTSRGIEVGFNSNATLLTRDIAERLVALGLGWLHVSLDGATAETYEGIRDGARHADVQRNLEGLLAARTAAGSALPRVLLVFVAMRRNVGELPALVRLAASWGVDGLWVQNLSHSFADTDPAGSYAQIRAFARDEALWAGEGDHGDPFAPARSLAAQLGVDLRLPKVDERAPEPRSADRRDVRGGHRSSRSPAGRAGPAGGTFKRPAGEADQPGGGSDGSLAGPEPGWEAAVTTGSPRRAHDERGIEAMPEPGRPGCDWPWRSTYVTHRGDVQPCCMVMGSDRATLGTLDEGTSFRAVWENDRYERFRQRLSEPGDPPEVCRGCSLYRGVF